MCSRKSEIGKNAIPHVARDVPAKTMDSILTAGLERTQNLAQILWIEACGERGRAHHVAKKHRNISPLSLDAARFHERPLQTRQLRHEPLPFANTLIA